MNNIIDETTKLLSEYISEEVKKHVIFELATQMADTHWTDYLLREYLRAPTTEESESVKKYIDSISEPTGISFDEIIDKLSQVPEVYTTTPEELRRIINEVNNNSNKN